MSELATSPAIGDENPVSSASAKAEPAPKQLSQWGEIRHRYVQNKLAVVGLVIITLLFLTAAFGDMLAPFDPGAQDLENTLASPNGTHWMGTDALGRDMFSRLASRHPRRHVRRPRLDLLRGADRCRPRRHRRLLHAASPTPWSCASRTSSSRSR